MKVYGYVSTSFESGSFLIKLIDEEGFIHNVLECFNLNKAPEIALKFIPRNYELIWLSNPWTLDEFKQAQRNYNRNYNVESYNLPKGGSPKLW